MAQIPHGPDNLICPLTLSAPLGPSKMSKVCHKCPLWVQLRGTNPNTGAEVDHWGCSLSHLPMLLVENAQQARAAGAATESMRNEIVKRMDAPRPIAVEMLPPHEPPPYKLLG
jgi:hypothetical protein